jgi:hypothetical protein
MQGESKKVHTESFFEPRDGAGFKVLRSSLKVASAKSS